MRYLNPFKQGESVDFDFELPDGADNTDYICTVNVLQKPGDTPTISRVIDASGNSWPGFLTSTETSSLAVGIWYMLAEMVNSTTDERVVDQSRFIIKTAWL